MSTETPPTPGTPVRKVKHGNLTPEMLLDWRQQKGMIWPVHTVFHRGPDGTWVEEWAGPVLHDGVPA